MHTKCTGKTHRGQRGRVRGSLRRLPPLLEWSESANNLDLIIKVAESPMPVWSRDVGALIKIKPAETIFRSHRAQQRRERKDDGRPRGRGERVFTRRFFCAGYSLDIYTYIHTWNRVGKCPPVNSHAIGIGTSRWSAKNLKLVTRALHCVRCFDARSNANSFIL